jgi:hypothetical protein
METKCVRVTPETWKYLSLKSIEWCVPIHNVIDQIIEVYESDKKAPERKKKVK